MIRCAMAICLMLSAAVAGSEEPYHAAENIFPLEHWHNHGSCIVECPNGDLLVCWFHGSGERTADDVLIQGSRRAKGSDKWSEPFVMADVPGFPDTNCCMIIDGEKGLWLLWPTILAHSWESALMKYKISTNYQGEGPPVWDSQEVLHMKPADNFAEQVKTKTQEYVAGTPMEGVVKIWSARNEKMAGELLTSRIGWFTRAHPYIINSGPKKGRMLVGLYSDGFSFSLVTWTDDLGKTWEFSEPIVGGGNIQPSFAQKKDGAIVSYMRDNGPPPKKVMVSESADNGATWSKVYDHPVLNNPGSGLEVANLSNGRWIVIYNDTMNGRHSLAVSISEDDGQTWPWTRHLELSPPKEGSYSYPSIIQAADGKIHASYSLHLEKNQTGSNNTKSIKHAEFNEAWVMAGDR